MPNRPIPPLPDKMNGLKPGSWAHDTIIRRWPDIIERTVQANSFSASVNEKLNALAAELPNGEIRTIEDPGAPDIETWNSYIAPHVGKNWLAPPWFFCEHYLYRRIMADVGFFQPGDAQGNDIFLFEKRQGLTASKAPTRQLAERLDRWRSPKGDPASLSRLLYLDLWGNQADLSLWPADGEIKPDHDTLENARAYLLADDMTSVVDHLMDADPDTLRVDILVDNAGFELVGDLALADYLLSNNVVQNVRLHVKPHPTYVSDAVRNDVFETLDAFKAEDHGPTQNLGMRLFALNRQDRLQIRYNYFWTSPLPGWKMQSSLSDELAQSHLVISKGDAHYRRLLGDRDWPHTTSFQDILAYYPAPILALRTAKAEIMCGLAPSQSEQLMEKDPDWLTNGRWGLVQFSG